MSVHRIFGMVLMGLGLRLHHRRKTMCPQASKKNVLLPTVTQQADKWYRAGQFLAWRRPIKSKQD